MFFIYIYNYSNIKEFIFLGINFKEAYLLGPGSCCMLPLSIYFHLLSEHFIIIFLQRFLSSLLTQDTTIVNSSITNNSSSSRTIMRQTMMIMTTIALPRLQARNISVPLDLKSKILMLLTILTVCCCQS